MSIEKDGAFYFAVCDNCGDALDACFEFGDAVALKKENGWKTTRVDGDWCDHCAVCVAAGAGGRRALFNRCAAGHVASCDG